MAHPLGLKAKKGPILIDEALKYPFVLLTENLLGNIMKDNLNDGWHDDHFPHQISYYSSSLKTIEGLVKEGLAMAYLPEYLGEQGNMIKLSLSDCPYHCKQKVKMFTRDKKRAGWLKTLFSTQLSK